MENTSAYFFIASEEKTWCCYDSEGLKVKAGHNLGSEAFSSVQMNPVWSVEFIFLNVFLKKWHFSASGPIASKELH